ncbi:WD-40 repeat-containing serine/threonine protein kinase [Reticulomyxa filosa]|uniref:WD-40 repeat-containing serine/threonine protein kinase n=1 Tax=Reticulomyxa filosa TaxID=46433 RepID=X6P9S0_RETFI|nr:WD-40 repeat-containing serine/threonine protein kinase [Reticulomyxa filosa]|eukprot:ETO34911.1 WD-40 repeat-containing serine/threonine protein kinase [Reticulomyxa filosa]
MGLEKMKMQLFITTKQGMKAELSIDKLRIFVTVRFRTVDILITNKIVIIVCINIENANSIERIVARNIVVVITTSQEADLIVKHWVRSSTIKRGWIYEFNKIIAKYAKGFKLSRILKKDSYNIDKLVFSADGRKFYLLTEDGTFEIWDIALGKKIRTFNISNEMQDFIVFSPDGSTFVSNTNNGMQSWNIESGKKVMQFEGIVTFATEI